MWGRGPSLWMGEPPPGPSADTFFLLGIESPADIFDVHRKQDPARAGASWSRIRQRHTPVAVINEAFARKFFQKTRTLSEKIFRARPGEPHAQFENCGAIAQDAPPSSDLRPGPSRLAHFLLSCLRPQHVSSPSGPEIPHPVRINLRGHGACDRARSEVVRDADSPSGRAAVDPSFAHHFSIQSMSEAGVQALQPAASHSPAHFSFFFGILSLVLASIGLLRGHGPTNAGRRVAEIWRADGCCGAQVAGQIVRLVLSGAFSALILFCLDFSWGVPLSLVAGRFLGNQLYMG